MKKRIIQIAVCVASALTLCACANKASEQTTAAPAQQEQGSETEVSTEVEAATEGETTTEMTESQIEESQTGMDNQGPRRIEPLPATISIEQLDNCMVPVSFDDSDLSKEGDTIKLHMTVYDYELFDMVDISLLKEGDTIVMDGAEVPVESVERNEYGLVAINGGQEQDGHDLYTDETGVYYESLIGDGRNFFSFGEATLPLSAEFVFTDNSDLDNPNQTYTAEEFTNLESYDDFIPLNTSVVIGDGEIQEIVRNFRP